MSNAPDIYGRDEHNVYQRATTTLAARAQRRFEGGAIGTATVEIFRSTETMDRGGVVIRMKMKDDASAFFPYAACIDEGIEIHLAGNEEARAMLAALVDALWTSKK